MRRPALFLDDGGVLSDNERRGEQWRRLVGDYLSRAFGGTAATWGEANRYAAERAWQRWLDAMAAGVPLRRAMREYDVGWMRDMAAKAGVALPAEDDAVRDLARSLVRYVTGRVRAFHPEVVPALRALHAGGFVLRTASGAIEEDLGAYLRAEGVRDLFVAVYGTDVVGTWKGGPDYYARVFAHAGVDPRDALVVDDHPDPVAWARQAGATALLLRRDGTRADLRSLDDLVERLG